MGDSVNSAITRDFCYKSLNKHCAALQTKMQDGKGGCTSWCDAIAKKQTVGCPSLLAPLNTEACSGNAVAMYNVTSPSFKNLVCPSGTDPTYFTDLETKLCCHYLKQTIESNCKFIPCEDLNAYVDSLQLSGGCSVAKECWDLGTNVDVSLEQKTFDRLRQNFRSCLASNMASPDITQPRHASNCTKSRALVSKGICKGYVLSWQACNDDASCGEAAAKDIEQTFTQEMCNGYLRNLCAAVGGRPRCKASCSWMCESMVDHVWPSQCSDTSQCVNPTLTSTSLDPVAPVCCSSLRRMINTSCENVDNALFQDYVAKSAAEDRGGCNASNCVNVPICSQVVFPEKYFKNEVFCDMLHNRHFLNQVCACGEMGRGKA